MRIYLDPGHGGTDPGAVHNGIKEADIVLDIALRVRKGLEQYENAEIKLSRTTDIFRTLEYRSNEANKWDADIFVSIHINSFSSNSADGFESFRYTSASTRTRSLQNGIHSSIQNRIKLDDRGQKQANFHVLRETRMPAVLTENGFISNTSDANKLKDSAFIQKIADGHTEGIAQFLGLKKKATSAPKEETPTSKDLYRVQVGAFASRENAEDFLKKVKADGYSDAYITD